MGITYGGFPLLADNTADEVQKRLIDPYLPIVDFQGGEPFVDKLSPRTSWREERGMSYPYHRPHCHDKINVLHWPTGAARWARFNALVTGDVLQQIDAACESGTTPLWLILKDELGGDDSLVGAKMFMLPPRALCSGGSHGNNDGSLQLFLLPLVDYRYFNQYKNTGSMSSISTWDALFSNLGNAIHSSGWTPPDTDYPGIPDVNELTRRYSSPAEILDAAAGSIGQRVVYGLDGIAGLDVFDADAWDAINDAFVYDKTIAGGETTSPFYTSWGRMAGMPAKLQITFPWWYYGAPDPNGDVYEIDQSPADTTIPTIPGTAKTIHTTAFADRSTDKTESTPDNSTDCQALAVLIARDYYARNGRQADMTIKGLINWLPTAFDDYIEWHFGSRSCGQYECHTRVKTLDHNWGPEEMFHQHSSGTNFVHEGIQNFTLAATLASSAGSSAMATFNQGSQSLKVYNGFGSSSVFSDSVGNLQGKAHFNGETLQWEIITLQCKAS